MTKLQRAIVYPFDSMPGGSSFALHMSLKIRSDSGGNFLNKEKNVFDQQMEKYAFVGVRSSALGDDRFLLRSTLSGVSLVADSRTLNLALSCGCFDTRESHLRNYLKSVNVNRLQHLAENMRIPVIASLLAWAYNKLKQYQNEIDFLVDSRELRLAQGSFKSLVEAGLLVPEGVLRNAIVNGRMTDKPAHEDARKISGIGISTCNRPQNLQLVHCYLDLLRS